MGLRTVGGRLQSTTAHTTNRLGPLQHRIQPVKIGLMLACSLEISELINLRSAPG